MGLFNYYLLVKILNTQRLFIMKFNQIIPI